MSYNPYRPQGTYRAVRGWYDENLLPTGKGKGRWFFRSLLEVECAKRLNLLIKCGETITWRYGRAEMQDGHWNFNERSKVQYVSNSQYTVDFEVFNKVTGQTFWIEVKGAPQGLTKIKRTLKHYPEKDLRVYTKKWGMEPAADYLLRFKMERDFRKEKIPSLIDEIRRVRENAKR